MLLDQNKKRQLFILLVLILSWTCAISFTVTGMYVVFAQSHYRTQQMPPNDAGFVNTIPAHRGKGGWWSLQDGVVMLVGSCMFNGTLMILMVVLLVRERRNRLLEHRQCTRTVNQEPPPDYDTVTKEDTPPPSYASLDLVSISTTSTSASPSPSASPHPPPAAPGASFVSPSFVALRVTAV